MINNKIGGIKILKTLKTETTRQGSEFEHEPLWKDNIDLKLDKIKDAYKSIDGLKMTSTILNIDLDVSI